jgi:site-specific DNA-methyltransferase (adenine-specific)
MLLCKFKEDYLIELNKIYNESCLDTFKKIESESLDLIIADPPYFEICGDFDFVWKNVEEYIEWCKLWLLESKRTLKKSGSLFLWGAIGFNKGYALPRLAYWMEQKNIFKINNWITQRNTRGRGIKKGFMQAREELLFCVKSDDFVWNTAYTEDKSNRKDLGANGKPRTNEFKRCSDVWIDIAEASQSSNERFHYEDGSSFPTVKPYKGSKRIVECGSNEGSLVYVPFAGSGTEIKVCIDFNRKWIASEINKKTIDEIILKRIT